MDGEAGGDRKADESPDAEDLGDRAPSRRARPAKNAQLR